MRKILTYNMIGLVMFVLAVKCADNKCRNSEASNY